MKAEELKERVSIFDILSKYNLQPNRHKMLVCPFHGDKNASLKIYDNNTFHCFGCGADGDIFKFVELMENCDFIKALEIVDGGKFQNYLPKQKIEEVKKSAPNPQEIKDYILGSQRNLLKTDYFTKRGLTTETQIKFGLGFDEKFNSVVIPYDKTLTYYQSRTVDKKSFYKPNIDIAGSESLFNEPALNFEDCVFIVESPICAMSIEQCGFHAIAICGTQGWHKLTTRIITPSCKLIVCLDNDFEGKKAQRMLIEALPDKCIAFNVADECKDINELLMKDKERLQKNLSQIATILRKIYFGGK